MREAVEAAVVDLAAEVAVETTVVPAAVAAREIFALAKDLTVVALQK